LAAAGRAPRTSEIGRDGLPVLWTVDSLLCLGPLSQSQLCRCANLFAALDGIVDDHSEIL
jgi:hypothetical protein